MAVRPEQRAKDPLCNRTNKPLNKSEGINRPQNFDLKIIPNGKKKLQTKNAPEDKKSYFQNKIHFFNMKLNLKIIIPQENKPKKQL